MRMPRSGFAVVALVLGLAGCDGSDPSGPEALQIAVVVLDGVAWSEAGVLDITARPVGEAHTVVQRHVDCSGGVWLDPNTHGSDACVLGDGDSNYLPAGTVLYRIEGEDPAQVLAVYREYDVTPAIDPEWVELAPVPLALQ